MASIKSELVDAADNVLMQFEAELALFDLELAARPLRARAPTADCALTVGDAVALPTSLSPTACAGLHALTGWTVPGSNRRAAPPGLAPRARPIHVPDPHTLADCISFPPLHTT